MSLNRSRPESPQPVFDRVVGGHFAEGPEYATWRTGGTDDFLLIHTVAGGGRFGAPDGELLVEAGDAVLLRPGLPHDYGTALGAELWEFDFAHFHPRAEWLPLLDWPVRLGGPGLIHAGGEVRRRVGSGLRRSAGMRLGALPRAELFAVNALEEALLWLDTQNPLASRTDERVLRVIEHVGSHLAEPLDVDTLAEIAHLSPSRLSHLFSEQLGISPQRYVERERMTVAKQLLDLTNRQVSGIAREVGWDDPQYFSGRFRRFAGVTPSAYRRRGRGA
ncbi:helix-turn-helix domain-containing protein [Lacisediminihabitans profunda]|uniref:Helix-turn-helix domain-containing protein n=1 Tax=Lacisediminihabitans profunda TaxID=2594790 RepID=A0A5C8UVN0_9MICO|nr:helix-turn-helix domain-containing protein [Lacisediminihabitans profunda]TXN32395.1 helix-turn-helix domain-containing protein [Lacisediminihabitans profunda]